MNKFFYKVITFSRILNRREEINDDDYNLLRWFIEKINRKLPVDETNDYIVNGPPDLETLHKRDTEIEDTTKVTSKYGDENKLNDDLDFDDFTDGGDGAY